MDAAITTSITSAIAAMRQGNCLRLLDRAQARASTNTTPNRLRRLSSVNIMAFPCPPHRAQRKTYPTGKVSARGAGAAAVEA
jgi:hypothetical protein